MAGRDCIYFREASLGEFLCDVRNVGLGGKFVGTGLLLRCEIGGSGNPLLWSLRTFRELLLRREVGDTPHAALILTVPKTPLPRASPMGLR